MRNLAIVIENDANSAPLYFQVQGHPKTAYLEIDPRGGENSSISIYAGINYEDSSIPFEVFNNLVYRIPCPNDIYGPALDKFLHSDEFKKMVKDLCYGYEHDLSLGFWNHDTDITEHKIEQDLLNLDRVNVLDNNELICECVGFYDKDDNPVDEAYQATRAVFDDGGSYDIEITEDNIEKIAKKIEKDLDYDCIVVGLDRELQIIIDNLI
jgi:hypothetical protein